MKTQSLTFHIDTEVAPIYLKEAIRFIHRHYLVPRSEFVDVRRTTVNGQPSLHFKATHAGMKGSVDVEIEGSRPIRVKLIPSDDSVPKTFLENLKNDLVVAVQIFEEKVRTTTLYLAWVEGKKIVPEALPSVAKRTTHRMITGNMLYVYMAMFAVSIFLFSLLGAYAPVAIIMLQLGAILVADKIMLRLGDWHIDLENPNIHLLQYHLPIREFNEFRAKYGRDAILKIKSEIYERTFAVGETPSCELGAEFLNRHGMKCDPERMSVKILNVYDLVRRASEKFHLPVPKIVVANTMLPNAAATGPGPGHGAILITTGLLVQLEEDEIFSVIGHEMGHLKGRDPLILFGLMASEYLLRLYVFLPFIAFSPLLYLMIAMGVIYFVAKFFEARADLESAMVIGQPQVLAEALRKIGFQKLQSETMPGYRLLGWINWDPHPPIYFRVDRLEQMESPVRVSHPLIQSAKDTINGFRAALV